MKSEIRFAALNDLERIVEIYNFSIPSGMSTADLEPVSVESRRDWFQSFNHSNRPLLVLVSDDVLVGWCGFRNFYGRPAYYKTTEVAIYIDPQFFGKGMAKKLLLAGINHVFQHGVENVLAFVFSHNQPSMNLFKSLGFEKKGELDEIADFGDVKRSLSLLQLKNPKP